MSRAARVGFGASGSTVIAPAARPLIQLLGPSRLGAQGTLSGTVRDASDSVLPGVSVRATSPALAGPRTALTNQEGRYSFRDLPDGTYTMTFALPGFVETTRSDIVLPEAADSPLDVVMRVGRSRRRLPSCGVGCQERSIRRSRLRQRAPCE